MGQEERDEREPSALIDKDKIGRGGASEPGRPSVADSSS